MYKKQKQYNNVTPSRMCKIKVFYRRAGNYDILETMAYAMEKLFILRDMGFKISNPDKKYIKSSLSKTEVERRFWELYDKYSEDE